MASQPLRLHSRADVSRIGPGTILFVGQTSFAAGLWVGIALDPGTTGGKNDGSVQGKRYFDAAPGMGVFVRPSQVQVISDADEEEEEMYDDDEQGPRNPRFTDDDDDDEGADDILSQQEPEPAPFVPPMRRKSVSTAQQPRPSAAAPSSTARTPMPRSRSSVMAPRRSQSPEKPSTLRPGPRPSLASRPSAASSVASSHSQTNPPSTARRTLASSPSKPLSRGSPVKPGARTPASSTSGTASGRASAASTSAAPMRRMPTSSSAASLASRTTSPTTPAARATAARPTLGSVAAQAARTPTTARASAAPRTAARTALPANDGFDAQSASARTGLRPVAKGRQSMAPSTVVPAARSAPRPTPQARLAAPQSDSPSTHDEDDGFGHHPLSPSEGARKRLAAAKAKMEARRHEDPNDSVGNSSEAEEDLVNMSLEEEPSMTASKSMPSMSSLEVTSLKREVEELRVKNRLNERRREEERARVKELEQWKDEVAEKLRMADGSAEKVQTMSSQLLSLQTSEKELSLIRADLEERIEDLGEQLEMAALDREMAEEKAEAAAAELENLKEVNEELSLEVEVLREENAMYEHGPPDEAERTSTGWIQLEKQNERLKAALIQIRDITSETDSEQKRRISELEKELSSLADVQDSRDALLAKLQASEAQLEDVKTQLDDALGAEEMLEQLTERNLFLGERMSEMAATIEELEALKELNEELEEVHVETEKQLQEEVDLKDMSLRERHARVEALEANATEYEATFGQFRELVLNLQNDVESLRAERDGLVEEGQNAQLNSQSREMLNLNLKLQSSALKSQARTIDADLGRMRAEQASMQLEMMQPYLPAPYVEEGDQDAVAGLLFFKRMSTKADLIKNVLEANHEVSQVLGTLSSDTADETQQNVPEHLVTVCQLRHSLAHFSAVCNSVAAMLRLAPPKTFLKCGRMFKEVQAAVEGRVDAFVEALRREELKEADCGAEFKRFVRQFEELSFALMIAQEEEIQHMHTSAEPGMPVPSGEGDLAAKEVGSATLLDLDLDTLAVSLSNALQTVGTLYSGPNNETVEWQLQGQTLEERYFEPLHRLLTDIKATKLLARKLFRRLASLASNDEAVSMDAIGELPSLGRLSSKMVAFATNLNAAVTRYTNDVRATKAPFTLQAALDLIRDATRELRMDEDASGPAASRTGDPWKEALDTTGHLAKTISGLVAAATEQENVIKLAGVAPWQPRAVAVHAIAAHNAELERQMLKLQDDLRDLYHQIKARDAALQESAIKIERLNRQLDRTKGQGEAHEEVKSRLAEARQQAKTYQDANESLQAELDALEKTNEELRAQVAAGEDMQGKSAKQAGAASTGEAGPAVSGVSSGFALHPGVASLPAAHLETHYLLDQLDAMRAALKFMREENALLKAADFTRELTHLAPLDHASMVSRGSTAESLSSTEQELRDAEELIGMPHKPRPVGPSDEDLRSVESERRHLYSSLLHLAASPRLVTLPPFPPRVPASSSADDAAPKVSPKSEDVSATGSAGQRIPLRTWLPASRLPSRQYDAQLALVENMTARFDKLQERRSTTKQRLRQGMPLRMPVLRSIAT